MNTMDAMRTLLLCSVFILLVSGYENPYHQQQQQYQQPYQQQQYQQNQYKYGREDEGRSHVEVTHTGFLENLGNSFAGAVFGFFCVLGGCIMLFWNEGRTVKQAKALSESRKIFVEAESDSPSKSQNNKLVHLSGRVSCDPNSLNDPLFKITVGGALALSRRVEVFQVLEKCSTHTEKKTGGGSTTTKEYRIEYGWDHTLHDSRNYHTQNLRSQNPTQKRFEDEEQHASEVRVGDFYLSKLLQNSLVHYTPYKCTAKHLEALPMSDRAQTHVMDGKLFIGANPSNPVVGDSRISFNVATADSASVMAMQTTEGGQFVLKPYKTKGGQTISLVNEGMVAAEEMLQGAESSNTVVSWVLRVLGVVLVVVGINICLGPIVALANVLPFLGSIMEVGTLIFSVLLGIMISFTVIAIAYLFYHPLLSLLLLGGVVAIFFLLNSFV